MFHSGVAAPVVSADYQCIHRVSLSRGGLHSIISQGVNVCVGPSCPSLCMYVRDVCEWVYTMSGFFFFCCSCLCYIEKCRFLRLNINTSVSTAQGRHPFCLHHCSLSLSRVIKSLSEAGFSICILTTVPLWSVFDWNLHIYLSHGNLAASATGECYLFNGAVAFRFTELSLVGVCSDS